MNFKTKPILGMIHLAGNEKAVQRAMEEIEILSNEGVSGIVVENYHGDISDVEKTLEAIQNNNVKDMLVGINVLPNDYLLALQLADKYDAHFIQVDYVAGNYKNAPRIDPKYFLECKDKYKNIKILGGVWPKYYQVEKDSDLYVDLKQGIIMTHGIVCTGQGTGQITPLEKIQEFRKIIGSHPLIVGAGMKPETVQEQLSIANGAIVGSCFKPYGITTEKINKTLVNEFMIEVRKVKLTES